MSLQSSLARIIIVFALILGACGSSESDGTTGSESTATTTGSLETEEATDTTTATTDPAPDEEEGDVAEPATGGEDGSDIDWATVDLTTIDWASIDMRTIDYEAILDNPTAADLTEETQALIASRLNPGSAILTIGDMTWEFDNFVCAVGTESTESDVYTLTTNTIADMDGTRVQIQATIRDDSEQGRVVGDGLVHEVQVDDISDFDNPAVDWRMRGSEGVTIEGYDLSAEGTFDNGLTTEDDAIPGTLVGTCGDQSRIP